MPTPRLDTDERRRRLVRRHGLAPGVRAAEPVAAAEGVVGFHGTDAASVFVSALARMDAGDIAAVERALYEDRVLLRVLAMRRTMFVAPVDSAAVMLVACGRDVAARERAKLLKLLEEAGVGDARWLARAEKAALAALERHEEATAPELAGEHPQLATVLTLSRGTNYEAKQKVISRVLTVLGAEGRAIRTRPRGSWTSTQFRWAALDRWAPAAAEAVERLGAADARAALAERWLRAFGPATLDDLRWWAGWNLGHARAALAALEVVDVDLGDGVEGVVLADDLEPEPAAGPRAAALLPALDATTMGWKRRDFYLGDHGPGLFDVNGNAGPTVWWDGRVVGAWAQAPDGEIRVRLLEDAGRAARAAIDAEAQTLGARVGDARLAPRARGRSPVERDLLA